MSAREVAEFEADPHSADAVRLRRWDEAAKEPDADDPGFEHYRQLLADLVRGAVRDVVRDTVRDTATAPSD